MRLKKKQKEALLSWMAEGLESGEINIRAAVFKPPFEVSRQQIDYYRKTRAVDLEAIRSVDENNALTTGLSLKEERVKKLQLLAALMERDLLGGFLWLEQVKSIGSGPTSEKVEYEEFNKAEVDAYRGVLDDIAKEVGDRQKIVEVKNWRQLAEQMGADPDTVDRLLDADADVLAAELFTGDK